MPQTYFYTKHHPRARKASSLTSMFGAAVNIALTYVIVVIIAAFLIVQVAEMISFILNPHYGIVWKLLWFAWIAFHQVAACFLAWIIFDTDFGPPMIEIEAIGWR